jgi:hypothetical protein
VATTRHLLASSTVSGNPIWRPSKQEINFSIVCSHKISAVHLLLGYKTHFTDYLHIIGSRNSLTLLGGIDSEPEVRNSRWQLPNRMYLYPAYIQDSKEIPTANPVFSGSRNSMALSERLHLRNRKWVIQDCGAKPEISVQAVSAKISYQTSYYKYTS